jgi:hypothetical protein
MDVRCATAVASNIGSATGDTYRVSPFNGLQHFTPRGLKPLQEVHMAAFAISEGQFVSEAWPSVPAFIKCV